MDKQRARTGLFAAGAVAAGALVISTYLGWFAPRTAAPLDRGFHVAANSSPQAASSAAPATTSAQPVALASSCPSEPLAAASKEADGRFALSAVVGKADRADASAFLAVAREAAQEGRMRDAEVALLAACNVAEQASGRASAPLADVKSQLGQHYVQLAALDEMEPTRNALLQRASALFSDSASAYASALGRNASKTRLAEQRLASLNAPETLRAALDTQAPGPTASMGAAQDMAQPRLAVPALVRSDPELTQLEQDLQRLRAQAATVSRDRAGLQRRDAQAVAARDTRCHDKACLRQWYAQRRAQLLNEF